MSNIGPSNDIIQQEDSANGAYTLLVDFRWKKFNALITEKGDPDAKPLYIVDYKTLKPHLVFKHVAENANFGTASFHTFSINADCELRGQPITLKALKRWLTQYEHLSRSFSKTDEPVAMSWHSSSGFKSWDFICVDEEQNPVAKFSANAWSFKKVGNIEFMSSKAGVTDAMREEIIITGISLFYCMLLRSSSILSFFGAIFASPGHLDKDGYTAVDEASTKPDKASHGQGTKQLDMSG